jgi:hypothetical protein
VLIDWERDKGLRRDLARLFGMMRRFDAACVNDVGNALRSLFPLRRINFVVSERDRAPDRAGRIAPEASLNFSDAAPSFLSRNRRNCYSL